MRNSVLVSLVAFAGFAVWCSSLAVGQAKITRPEVSESACPVQVIEVPTQEGRHTTAAVRKPPGKGPFPAAIYLHGTLQPRETKTLVHSLRDQTGSRFLAAGYVTVAATFRSRSNDPLTRDALEDCLAVIAHVKKIPEVDPQSVVLWGDSGGGSLVLELAGETSLCAVTACEPATVLFTGLYSRENLGGKPPYSAGSGMKTMEDPKAYYTPALQKLTREKIAKIACPAFIAHGDRHIINKVNNEVFVPEMKQAARPADTTDSPFVFRDAGAQAGLFPHVAGIRGHAAAWGDVDGNGWPDLFVGTFHNSGSKPGMLFLNEKGKFRLDEQEHLHTTGIDSGAMFIDLANSGRLDLYVSTCAHSREGVLAVPSMLFRNDGHGKLTDVSQQSGACPPGYEGRGLAALDFDGDGLLDFVTCEQYYASNAKTGPALYHNRGGLRFENVSESAGLPAGLGGLGVAAADINNDGWPDICLTNGAGDHRLLLNDGHGKFRDAPGAREVLRWKSASEDDTPAGVCIADVNRDGLADIVIGHHFKSPWVTPASIRLYLNRGIQNGVPALEDVTEAAGLKPLEMKAPHVEIQDFDNDGWPDIYVSIVKFREGQPHPIIYKNLGGAGGIPHFRADAWNVNDFPTAEDKAIRRSGPLFEKILKEKKIIYIVAPPKASPA